MSCPTPGNKGLANTATHISVGRATMPNYTQTKLMCLVYSIYVLVHAQKNTKMTCEKCGKSLFPGTMFETD